MIELFKYVCPQLKEENKKIILIVFFSVIMAVFSTYIPVLIGSFIDNLANDKIRNDIDILNFCMKFSILSMGNVGVTYCTGIIIMKTNAKSSYKLNKKIIEHLYTVPYSYIKEYDPTYLTQRINSDSNEVIGYCTDILQNVITNLLSIILAVEIVLMLNYSIIVLLIILSVVYYFIYIYMRKIIYKKGYLYKERQAILFENLNFELEKYKFIKNNGIIKLMLKRLDKSFWDTYNKAVDFQKQNIFFSMLSNIISTAMKIIVFIIGGINVINKTITIGEFTMLFSYISIILQAIQYFFNIGKTTIDAKISLDRLKFYENIKSDKEGTLEDKNIYNIKLKNIRMNYGDRLILNKFTYDFNKGEIYGVVGENGSGKSTLLDIIIGYNKNLYKGEVYYNDCSIKSIDMYSYRKEKISFVEQEPVIIADTIRFNICLNKKYSEEKIKRIVQAVGLDKFIQKLQHGLDTSINEGMSNISGGEKQKIALARALIKESDVLILDEPTSAMDEESKKKMFVFLNEQKNKKIIIIVTHDNAIKKYLSKQIVVGEINE